MQSGEWQWWSGSNDEYFSNGPFGTRDEALEALEGEGGYITEATQDPLLLSDYLVPDLDTAKDQFAEGDRASEYDDNRVFNVTPDQEKNLIAIIKEAINAWQLGHGLVFTCHTFSAMRNDETISE